MSVSRQELLDKTIRIAEQYYGTATDANQIPIVPASNEKLERLHPKCVLIKVINDEPVSWSVVVPTSRSLAEQFVAGTITEKELFDRTEPATMYEALYFCSVFTVPEYYRQGFATALLRESLASIPLVPNPYLCCWIFSPEGEKMYRAVTVKYNITIHRRVSK